MSLLQDTEIAFDGREHQVLWKAGSLMSIRGQDSRNVPTAIPNPAFLPVSFLGMDPALCPGCQFLLDDIRGREWEVLSGHVLAPKGNPKYLVVPGPADETGPTEYRVTVKGAKVSRIEHHRVGAPISVLELSYGSVGGLRPARFPSHMVLTHPTTELHFVTASLEINRRISPEAFQIPWNHAHTVVDENTGKLLKHYQLGKEEWDPRAIADEQEP